MQNDCFENVISRKSGGLEPCEKRELDSGQHPPKQLQTGKMAGLPLMEEESRGEEATEAAKVATEDGVDEVPAVVDTLVGHIKNRS